LRGKISTGINDGTRVQIKSGIASGQTVYYPKANSTPSGGGFGFSRLRNRDNSSGNRDSGSGNGNNGGSNGNNNTGINNGGSSNDRNP
jgi:HlyD family secretion protein